VFPVDQGYGSASHGPASNSTITSLPWKGYRREIDTRVPLTSDDVVARLRVSPQPKVETVPAFTTYMFSSRQA